MIKPNPETRNVIVEVYVDVPFTESLAAIERDINRALMQHAIHVLDVTDIEAKENRGERE